METGSQKFRIFLIVVITHKNIMCIFHAVSKDVHMRKRALRWISSTKEFQVLHAENATIIAETKKIEN
jgi:hypothetical protein